MSSSPDPTPSLRRPISCVQLRELIATTDTQINFTTLDDDTLFRDAGADSFDYFTIILVVQDAAGIKIPDNDIASVNSLNKLAQYLNERLP